MECAGYSQGQLYKVHSSHTILLISLLSYSSYISLLLLLPPPPPPPPPPSFPPPPTLLPPPPFLSPLPLSPGQPQCPASCCRLGSTHCMAVYCLWTKCSWYTPTERHCCSASVMQRYMYMNCVLSMCIHTMYLSPFLPPSFLHFSLGIPPSSLPALCCRVGPRDQ